MALSNVEICNRALQAIGHKAITALDEGTERADLCNRLYFDLRDELIQDHPWNFATRRASLAALSTAPAFGWDLQYQLPTDCVRVLGIDTPQWPIGTPITSNSFEQPAGQWEVEGRRILTNEIAPLRVVYMSNAPTEDEFPPKFTSALVLRIAMDLAMPITESMTKRAELAKEYMSAIRSARGADAREHGPQRLTSDVLAYARL